MKIYIANPAENDNIEILLDHQELKNLIASLTKFENEISRFKLDHKSDVLGFTHLHLKDCNLIDTNQPDIVFYVDLTL